MNESGKQPIEEITGKKRYGVLFLTAILLLVAGLWSAKEAGRRTDLRMRRELVRQAVTVASAIPADEAQALSFTIEDLNRPEYHRICASLKAFAEVSGTKSIYTMALRDDGTLVFGPESLEPESPGDVYRKPSAEDFKIFETGEPFSMGPFSDEYGTFISASAPVSDPQTGEVMLTLGIDIEVPVWEKEIHRAQSRPVLLSLIPIFFLAIGGWLMKLRSRVSSESKKHLHHAETILCIVAMLLMTGGTATLFYMTENASRTESFHSTSLLKAGVYIDELKGLHQEIKMLSNFFESSALMTRSQFHSACKALLNSHTITGCAWIPEISADRVAEFEAQARADGLTDFSVHNIPGQEQAAASNTLYPVLYAESWENPKSILGLNVYSEPQRAAAIDEANRSGHATASSAITLAIPGTPPGIVIYQPVSTERQKGLIAIIIRLDRLMSQLMRQTTASSIGLTASLVEISAEAPPKELACAQNGLPWASVTAGLHQVVPLFLFGKAHAVVITPTEQWFEDHPLRNWRIALFAGLILTVLITGIVSALTNRPVLLAKMIRQRTGELEESEKRLSLATDSAHLGIWEFDIVSARLLWDDRMHKIYGIEKAEAEKDFTFWEKCVHPDDLQKLNREIRNAIYDEFVHFDTEFRIIRPDGQVRHIRACAKVSREQDGTPLRMTGINLDITDQKQSEERIASQLEELNRWNTVTMGREYRVLELKTEINEILRQNNQPPRYQEIEEKG